MSTLSEAELKKRWINKFSDILARRVLKEIGVIEDPKKLSDRKDLVEVKEFTPINRDSFKIRVAPRPAHPEPEPVCLVDFNTHARKVDVPRYPIIKDDYKTRKFYENTTNRILKSAYKELGLIDIEDDMRRSSFHRFGDDLSEVILGFLPITDKIRLQCLSKCVRPLIFTHQYSLILDPKEKSLPSDTIYKLDSPMPSQKGQHFIDPTILEYILMNCPNLTMIRIEENVVVDSEIIDLIAKYCKHLQKIFIKSGKCKYINRQSMVELGRSCSKSLKLAKLQRFDDQIKELRELFSMATHLNKVVVKSMSTIITPYERWAHYIEKDWTHKPTFMPNLRQIDVQMTRPEEMIQFQKEYHNQITDIHMVFSLVVDQKIAADILAAFGRFRRLNKLSLVIFCQESGQSKHIFDALQRMCKGLSYYNTLKDLKINIAGNFPINANLFGTFAMIQSIESLYCRVYGFSTPAHDPIFYRYGSIRDLRPMKKLKRMHIEMPLSEDDIQDADIYLPYLERIFFLIPANCSDDTFTQFARLKNLTEFIFYCINVDENYTISDSGIKQMLDNCPNLRRLSLRSEIPLFYFKITTDIIHSLKDKARQKPKQNFYFELTLNKELNKNIDTNVLKASKYMPQNMRLCIHQGCRSVMPIGMHHKVRPIVKVHFHDRDF